MTTPVKFFLYVRKSTDEEKRQVTSLDAQTREMRELAKRERFYMIDVFQESRTAKEPGRPIFNEMLERLEKGEANGILCWDIDRLYRNPFDEGRVRWMLQRGIIKMIQTANRSYGPDDAGILIAVEGGRATDFIIHHRRDVMRGVREKLLRGEWPGARPVGYLYDHDKRNIVPDPKRAKIVQTIYEGFSAGRHGLLWVSDHLAKLGVLNRSGKQWSKSQTHSFLTNKLYIGIMMWNGESFEGKYKPLISPELFRKVQHALKNRSKPRKTRIGHNFPFCGLFRCSCGSMISAQWAKGHGGLYRYYRCTKKTQKCFEPYLQERVLADQCHEALLPLAISADEANFVRALIDKETAKDGFALQDEGSKLTEKISRVQEQLNKLTRGFLDELIDEESYQSAKADLVLEKIELKQEKERLQKSRASFWNEPAKEVIKALELAGKTQPEKSLQEISQLVQKIGTNRLITGKKVTFSFSEPYEFTASFLGNLHSALAENPSLRSNDSWQSSNWCPRQDLNLYDVTH